MYTKKTNTKIENAKKKIFAVPLICTFLLRRQQNVYLCDFAKTCPLIFRLNTGFARVQVSVAEKKKTGRLASY